MVEGPLLLIIILLSIIFIIISSSIWKLHPFISLLLATMGVGIVVGIPAIEVIRLTGNGFGMILGNIGLIVILGSIIGIILEKSGATIRIAEMVLNLVGKSRPGVALTSIGAIVSVPVFCDSGFIILSGLTRSLAQKSKTTKATLALGLSGGLYTTHTLIPPTPGPIAAAGNIGATQYLGLIMLTGLIVSLPVLLVTYIFATRFGKNIITTDKKEAEIKAETNHPSGFSSLLPIVLPLILIAIGTILNFYPGNFILTGIFQFTGNPTIALLIGVFAAFHLIKRIPGIKLREVIGAGIKQAGPILVLTGAGGAFGMVLKATPITSLVESWVAGDSFSGPFFLIITFLTAALLKTSQGSSTSALVITSSLLAPLTLIAGFDSSIELALVVMALGGGAMTISHANDSYFWVVSQFSGIKMNDAYRSYTLMTFLQGLTALAVTLLLYFIFV